MRSAASLALLAALSAGCSPGFVLPFEGRADARVSGIGRRHGAPAAAGYRSLVLAEPEIIRLFEMQDAAPVANGGTLLDGTGHGNATAVVGWGASASLATGDSQSLTNDTLSGAGSADFTQLDFGGATAPFCVEFCAMVPSTNAVPAIDYRVKAVGGDIPATSIWANNGGAANHFGLTINGGSEIVNDSVAVTVDVPLHWALCRDVANLFTVYHDGVANNTATDSSHIKFNHIANGGGGANFGIHLAEVAFYQPDISAARIAAHAAAR